MPLKAKSHRSLSAKADPTQLPAPVTSADRIVLEIRKFIAAAIFFNTQAAEKAGLVAHGQLIDGCGADAANLGGAHRHHTAQPEVCQFEHAAFDEDIGRLEVAMH